MAGKVTSIFRKMRVCGSMDACIILVNNLGSINNIITRSVTWKSAISNRIVALYYAPNSIEWSLSFLSISPIFDSG